jgi:uncharacterized membrane protein
VLEKEENYAKAIKNWIVVISSITFIVNLYYLPKIDNLWLVSFTYLASTGLTFYNFSPIGEAAKRRRYWLIHLAIGCIAFIIIFGIVSQKTSQTINLYFLLIIKAIFIVFSAFSCYSTFVDDSDRITDSEKDAAEFTKKRLREKEKNKPYIGRDRKIKENTKTKNYVIGNLKSKKEQKK